jgi:two-component system response regulator DevR
MIRLVFADDHELTRRGLRDCLSAAPDIQVLGEATDGHQAWDLIFRHRPDIALLDIRMPGLSGPAVCHLVTSRQLATACIMLTAYADQELLRSALAAGARGYLVKDIGADALIQAIRQVAVGGGALDPASTAHLMRWVAIGSPPVKDPFAPVYLEILRLVAEGLTNREIGEHLHFSENTVKLHVNHIMERLGAKNRVAAAVMAHRQGLI